MPVDFGAELAPAPFLIFSFLFLSFIFFYLIFFTLLFFSFSFSSSQLPFFFPPTASPSSYFSSLSLSSFIPSSSLSLSFLLPPYPSSDYPLLWPIAPSGFSALSALATMPNALVAPHHVGLDHHYSNAKPMYRSRRMDPLPRYRIRPTSCQLPYSNTTWSGSAPPAASAAPRGVVRSGFAHCWRCAATRAAVPRALGHCCCTSPPSRHALGCCAAWRCWPLRTWSPHPRCRAALLGHNPGLDRATSRALLAIWSCHAPLRHQAAAPSFRPRHMHTCPLRYVHAHTTACVALAACTCVALAAAPLHRVLGLALGHRHTHACEVAAVTSPGQNHRARSHACMYHARCAPLACTTVATC